MTLRSDLPIKYYLNLHNDEALYDQYSALFEILQYLVKVAQSKNTEINWQNLKFSSKSLKYIFGEKLKAEDFKQYIVASLKYLIANEYLNTDGDFIIFTEKGITYFYITND